MAAIEDLLDRKKPQERSVDIILDPESGDAVTITFRAVARDQWRQLIEQHPATDDQQNEFVQGQARQGIPPSKFQRLRWNADTFPPVAIAACAVDPEMTPAQAEALWSSPDYNEDELGRIFAAVVAANESADGTVAWGKGSGTTRR